MTPPGWYPDPSGEHELRYWDGSAWTAHVANGGQASVAPVPAPERGTLFTEPSLLVRIPPRREERSEWGTIEVPGGIRLARAILVQRPAIFDGHTVVEVSTPEDRRLFAFAPYPLYERFYVVWDPSGNEVGRMSLEGPQSVFKTPPPLQLWTVGGFQGRVLRGPEVAIFDAFGLEVARGEPQPRPGAIPLSYCTVSVKRQLEGPFATLAMAALLTAS